MDCYTAEVVFSRVVEQSLLLSGVVRREYFRYLDDAWFVGHMGAQMYEPLIKPASGWPADRDRLNRLAAIRKKYPLPKAPEWLSGLFGGLAAARKKGAAARKKGAAARKKGAG